MGSALPRFQRGRRRLEALQAKSQSGRLLRWCPKPALTTLVPRAGALACLASLNWFVGLINDQSGKVNRLLCGSTFPSKLATAPNPSNTLAK